MNSSQKINLILRNVNNNINKLSLKKNHEDKMEFIYFILDDIKDLLEFIIKTREIDKDKANEILEIVEFQMLRIFEVSEIDKNEFKNYLNKHN